jgi:uncharacterized protein (DUF1501 family)
LPATFPAVWVHDSVAPRAKTATAAPTTAANVMFVLGGPVKGGKVYGRWLGLDQSQLYEGRDLAVTTDFRLVLSEVVSRYLGNKDLKTVFPGFEGQPAQFVKFLG